MAILIHVSVVAGNASKSLLSRRERLSQPKVRSMCQPQYGHPDIFCRNCVAWHSSSEDITHWSNGMMVSVGRGQRPATSAGFRIPRLTHIALGDVAARPRTPTPPTV